MVYLAFFFMLYREGMPGSILFAGICAVVYFVVGIRFGNELMADDCTSIGEFSVLLLIVILSALLVNSYCKKASVVWYIGGIGVGDKLKLGETYYFQGVVTGGMLERRMVNPQVRTEAQITAAPLEAVYPQTDGLSSGS